MKHFYIIVNEGKADAVDMELSIVEYLESIAGDVTADAPAVQDVVVEVSEDSVENKSNASKGNIEKVVLESISDKTGYPTDMIDIEMELETDLGIDSIKRVEIFSAVFTTLDCSLTPDEIAEMSALSDIQSIVAYLSEKI